MDGVYYYYINTTSLRYMKKGSNVAEHTYQGDVIYHKDTRDQCSIPAYRAFGIQCMPTDFHVIEIANTLPSNSHVDGKKRDNTLPAIIREYYSWSESDIQRSMNLLLSLVKNSEHNAPSIIYMFNGNVIQHQEQPGVHQPPPVQDETEVRFQKELVERVKLMIDEYVTEFVAQPENLERVKQQLLKESQQKPALIAKYTEELRKRMRRERNHKRK
jgi:hypothetical protein